MVDKTCFKAAMNMEEGHECTEFFNKNGRRSVNSNLNPECACKMSPANVRSAIVVAER